MASSPPSIFCGAMRSSVLGEICPPHRPRPWRRHWGRVLRLGAQVFYELLARAGVLILSAVRMEDPGARLASCRAHGSAGISSCSPAKGVTPEGRLILSRRALLSNLSGFLEVDELTHLLYLTPCLVHLLGGPQWWTHFGSIRGTPCSTAATVAPGHGPGGFASVAAGAMT